jgi:hypothetical protein
MTRVDVIQYLLNRRRKAAYLEIGVRRGDCFCEIDAWRKVAVDPQFHIGMHYYWHLRNLFSAQYFECTSDVFFGDKIRECRVSQFDVVFVDGLHTFQQTFKDVQNSLRYLKAGGWILLHDCNPLSEIAAVPAESYIDAKKRFGLAESRGAWNGDVWKTVVRLRSESPDLQVVVLGCDEGLAMIRRGVSDQHLHYAYEQIQAMTYEDFDKDRVRLINLKSPDYLFSIQTP